MLNFISFLVIVIIFIGSTRKDRPPYTKTAIIIIVVLDSLCLGRLVYALLMHQTLNDGIWAVAYILIAIFCTILTIIKIVQKMT